MGRKLAPGVDDIDEKWVKQQIYKLLEPYPYLHTWMPPAGMHGSNGQHDFFNVQIGLFWTIEAKAGANTPTAGQIKFAREIQTSGGLCICVNEWNLRQVSEVAAHISTHYNLPLHLNHNFDEWTPKKYA